MGVKEYFLNPKKRQVYVEALAQSVATTPSSAKSKAETKGTNSASPEKGSAVPKKAP